MLKRYNDFLFESLMLESILVYSADFKQILTGMNSPVAKSLLDLESQDLTLANNFIDIADNKEEISFVQDKKAQQMLKPDFLKKVVYYVGSGGFLKHSESNQEMFDMLDYQPVGQRCYQPFPSEKGEVQKKAESTTSGKVYLKVKFPGGISVIHEEKVRYDDVNKLPFTLNRQQIRIGRGIKGILSSAKINFTDAQIEEFVNIYKSEIDKMNDIFKQFEIVKGEDITHWYDQSNYEHTDLQIGTLGKSCMRYERCSNYFKIYTENTDVCSLLILKTKDGKRLKGRALIWELDKPSGITYMDRTYTHADSDFDLFRQYAEMKGWYRRPTNDFNSTHKMLDPEGNQVDMGNLIVKVEKGEYSRYPYLDTLKYYTISSGILTTYEIGSDIKLDSTDVSRSIIGSCDDCGGDGHVMCPECEGDGQTSCENCGGDGEISCYDCSGEGKQSCPACDGDGNSECSDCDGNGMDEDGEKCGNCEGEGRLNCDDCRGEGEIDCPNCEGNGYESCDDCRGNGMQTCIVCYGDETVDCPECRG